MVKKRNAEGGNHLQDSNIIIKPSVEKQFDRFLRQGRVLFFSAPCGFGKTAVAEALLSGQEVSRLSVGSADLRLPPEDGGWRILLLDDLQDMQEEQDWNALCELIRACPDRRFVLLSRGTPPGCLMAFQYTGLMTVLEADDLLFDADDVRRLLRLWGANAADNEIADHRVATTTYALTVNPKTLTRNDLTHSGPITKVYDTTSNAPTDLSVSVKPEALVNGDTLPITGTLVYNSANVNEANTITFTPNAVTTGNYRLAESEVLTITDAKITPAPHNCANPTGLTAKYGQKLSDVTLTNPEGNLPGTWSWQNPGTVLDQVGTRNYSANFKPESPNYQEVKNAEIAVAVGKADAPTLADTSKSQKYTVTSGKVTVNTAGMPADAGTLTYTAGTPSVKGAATASFTVDGNGLVTYTITGGAAGDIITLPVTIGSVNYADATANVVITLLPRNDQKALTIIGGDTVVYGQTLTFSATGGSGSGKVTYRVTSGTGEAAIDADTGVLTPVKVGTVKVKAIKAADMDFNEVTSNEIEVTITPATPTGEPKYTKITSPGKTLADADLTVTDSTLNPNAGTLEWLDDEGNVLPDDTKVKANKTYTWRFTPDDTNYTILTGSIELYHKSRGGGGSSGDNTTTAADGSEVLSPNTGDAGLLAYGVMALSGCAGTALLLRRRKRED